MKKENILVIVLICILFAGISYVTQRGANEKIEPMTSEEAAQAKDTSGIEWWDYAKGRELAKESGKHIFLYFHADWCSACNMLKLSTFKDEAVLAYLKENFIAISIDTDIEKEMSDRWGVQALPTLWFLEADGSKISHVKGYMDKKYFLDALKFIHTEQYVKN